MSTAQQPINGEAVRLATRVLTAADVAELLQLPQSTVYELARSGRLPSLRIGRAVRFSQATSNDISARRATCSAESRT